MARKVEPPPTKFGPAVQPQAKAAAGKPRHLMPPPTRFGPAAVAAAAARPAAPRTLQRSLVRHNFTSATQKEVTLSKGEHRRHIIPHHLMKLALQAWANAHHTTDGLQALLDRLNNHVANLIPGEGVQNSAMGMVSTWGEKKLEKLGATASRPADLAAAFANPSGFYQDRQKQMLAPVTAVFTSDPHLSKSTGGAVGMARNIVDSTDFDWPGGTPQEYEAWRGAYNAFQSLRNNAAAYSRAGMLAVCDAFLGLAAPSGRHG